MIILYKVRKEINVCIRFIIIKVLLPISVAGTVNVTMALIASLICNFSRPNKSN